MIVCPACGGNLKFNIKLQKLSCPSCDSAYDPYEFDDKNSDVEENNYETTIYTCPQCSGELESTDTDVTGFCPFCGASDIFYSRLSREMKPDYIIPFIKTKEDCKRLYKEKAAKALFLPKEYKDESYIDGFRGIYVPYWSYNLSQKGPIVVKAEKSHRSGDYIIHDHYDLMGDIDSFYNGVSHDASSSFSDEISESIAPFDVKAKKAFTAGYLSGFYADTADVTSDIYLKDATDFAISETADEIRHASKFKGYDFEDLNENTFNTTLDKIDRTMYPVWFMSYRNKDRVAYATVNGQTGKVSADFPIDIKKYLMFAAGLAVVLFIILNMMFTLKPSTVSTITAVLAVVSLVLYCIESSAIKHRENNELDRGYNAGVKVNGSIADSVRHMSPLPVVLSSVAFVMALICRIINSINDMVHYTTASICSVCIAVTLIYLIKDYNILATRPLPQFKRKGGDDSAK